MPRPTVRPNDVFINLPFEPAHERRFLAYLASLASLGLTPRSVLEVGPDRDRLHRLVALMGECAYSIHDLSHVRLSRKPYKVPRFNMSFELGLCASLSMDLKHRFRVFEEVPHRLGQSLSDLQGYEPFIHVGTIQGVIGATLDAFADLAEKPLNEEGTVFRPRAFRQLSTAAVRLVSERVKSRG